MELMDYLQQAKHSLFRFEGLQEYDVASEEGALNDFLETGCIDESLMQSWWDFVESKTTEGVQMRRVRLVIEPLTDYTKMELTIHRKTVTYGDDIRIISQSDFDTLNMPLQDFWLIDSNTVLVMGYDKKGKFWALRYKMPIPENLWSGQRFYLKAPHPSANARGR